jgi:hypothetical protein
MGLRALARHIRDGSRRSLNRVVLKQGLMTLERTLARGRTPDPRVLRTLERGWANSAWSADIEFLSAMLHWLQQTSGPIVECGSGLSTLVLACAASLTARRVHSFEHDTAWGTRIARELPTHLGRYVELHMTPLRSYGDFDWYSLEGLTPPIEIGFILCDGPPGGTRGGRYGLAPVLHSQMAKGCIVLVDDTQRPAEHDIVRRWCSELDASIVHEGSTYSVLCVGSGAVQQARVCRMAETS